MGKREIKFRAWVNYDGRHGEMLLNVQNHVGKDGWGFGQLLNNDEIHVMQYTGLKDKNGKPIYDGDVVRYIRSYSFCDGYDGEPIDTDRTVTIIAKVVFYPSRGWQFKGKSSANDDIEGGYLWQNKNYCSLPSYINEYAEIIGNIHEKPRIIKSWKGSLRKR